MNFIKILLLIFEFSLFSSLAFFVFSGYTDSILSNIPYISQITGMPILLIFGACAFILSTHPEEKLTTVSSFGIAVLTLSLIRMSLIPVLPPDSLFHSPLLYIVIVGTGVLGYTYSWLLPFILFISGDLYFSTSSVLTTSRDQWLELVQSHLLHNALDYTYLFSAGLMAAITQLKVQTITTTVATHSRSSDQSPANQLRTTPTETTLPQESTQHNKTQVFTIDYNTGLSQNQSENIQEVLSSVVYFMCRNFKAYSTLGFIYDPSNQTFILNSFHSKSLHIVKGVQIPLGTGVVGKIGTEKRSFMSGDYSFYTSELLYYHGPEEINSILAVPVISENNELLGTLVLDSGDKNAFKEQDKEILKRFSSLAAALITNTRIRIFQERAARTFQIYYEASHKFTTALSLDEVFNVLFQIIPMITSCSRQMAIIYNENEKSASVYRIQGIETEIVSGFKFALNSGLYSFVLKNRKLINVPDFNQYENKYFRFVPDEPKNPNIRSLIIFPIIDDESRCRGLFSVESNQPNQFHNEIQQVFTTIIENASVAFTRALLYKKMEKLATTDGLTELNNHRHFQDLLSQEFERSRRYDRVVSLLLLDIDHFKSFNDTYGHPVGDLVLKEISACIRQSIRVNDIPARYGGEEFTVILPETTDKGGLIIAERIRTTIENHTTHSLDKQLKVTVSIGCASYNASEISQKELIDHADKALYYSKEHGRNRVTLFTEGMVKPEK